MVDLLLERDSQLLDQPGVWNRTALLAAAAAGREALVEALLKRGADPRKRDAQGNAPLDWAVKQGHAGVAASLAAHDAGITNLSGAEGLTPLMLAAVKGDAPLAQVLLEHGADPHVRDAGGLSALDGAAGQGNRAVAALLRER